METAKSLVTIITLLVGFPVLLMTVLDKLAMRGSRAPKSPKERGQELLRTEWSELIKHFDAPVPESLKALYTNRSLLTRTEFELPAQDPGESNYVASFLPATLDSLEHWDLSDHNFPFAVDGCGNCYTFDWTTGKIGFWDHEDGEEYQVAESLAEFLAQYQRRRN